MSAVKIVFPAEPISAITRHQVEAKMAAARMQWELTTAACRMARQNEQDEREMHDMLGWLLGTPTNSARKRWEFATAARHAAEQALINQRRAYDMLCCLLEAGPGHVFSAAVLTERGSVLPHCRHCRACAGSFKASERCTGDIHRCPRSVRPGESDRAVTVHGRKDLLCAQPGAMTADFTRWACKLGHVTDQSHAENHLRHLSLRCIPATCPWPDLMSPSGTLCPAA